MTELNVAGLKHRGRQGLDWKWAVRGTRKSGETTTSTANFLVNQLVFAFICHKTGQEGRLVCVGDDAVGRMPDPSKIVEAYSSFGMKLELEVEDSFEKIGFCSSRAVKVFGSYRFVREIPRAFLKFGWSSKKRGARGSKSNLGYLFAKALSHQYEYEGVPVVGDFFKAYATKLKALGARFSARKVV